MKKLIALFSVFCFVQLDAASGGGSTPQGSLERRVAINFHTMFKLAEGVKCLGGRDVMSSLKKDLEATRTGEETKAGLPGLAARQERMIDEWTREIADLYVAHIWRDTLRQENRTQGTMVGNFLRRVFAGWFVKS